MNGGESNVVVKGQEHQKRMELYTINDVKSTRSIHTNSKEKDRRIVIYGVSDIKEAEMGICACEYLYKNDIVTFYSGKKKATAGKDTSRTIQYNRSGLYIEGLEVPKVGQGLAAFVNKEDRKKRKYANCELIAIDGTIFLEMTRGVKGGGELYASYGNGYRL